MRKTKLFSLVATALLTATTAWAAVAVNGKLPNAFSVSATKVVYFSQGNLQYKASTGTWRFATNQYDYVGNNEYGNVYENEVKCNNASVSSSYTGWIDLFGWGTSGWNNGNRTAYQPYATSTSTGDYGVENPKKANEALTGDYANGDWGVYNAAQLGADWRTLTGEEWKYLLQTRSNASNLYKRAKVCEVPCLILLPDGWTPNGVTFPTYTHFMTTTIDASDWAILEAQGAVLLPAAGWRNGTAICDLDNGDQYGYYWASTSYYQNQSDCMWFNDLSLYNYTQEPRNRGYAVRLVSETAPPTMEETPLTFEAMEAGATVTYTLQGSAPVQYSLNGGAWTNYSSAITLSNVGDKVSFRGNNDNYNSADAKFQCSADCYIYGNIMSLVDATNFATTTTLTANRTFFKMFLNNTQIKNHPSKDLVLPATTLSEDCYSFMFYGCTGLTSAPALPATTLTRNCYYCMFRGCTGLTGAPALPATTLADYCYYYMFRDCTGLISAPELPVTTLANFCYAYMFKGCTGLTSAPALPATTLANNCYYYMFEGCTGLTSAPALPATTLATACYQCMFYGCTDLTSAPELPATTLVTNCYYQMFYGCTNLSSVTCLATSRSNTNATTEWLSGVAESGTFYGPKNSILASVERGVSTIPTGWNVTTIFIGSGTEADPYIISSTEEWNYLAEKVAAGTDYSGKFFRQTADISVTTMVGTSSSKFSGTYDGDGHTLTVSYTNNSANATAPFRFIDGATIKNLHTAGTITTNKQFASGLAADVYNNSTILNCRSSVYITSNVSGDGTHGGLIGRTQGGASPIVTTIIEGCVFDGKLLGTSTNSCGGLCGWCAGDYGCRLTIRNSLYIPAQRTISTSSSKTLSRASSLSDVTVTNSYYSETFGGAQGKKACSITGASGATVANSGTATVYNVSGITAYGTGIKYNDVLYGGNGDAISLTLSGSTNYKASAGTLTGSSNPRTLTMTTANTVIYGAASVTDAPIANSLTYNGAEQALVNAGTASGGTMYYSLDNSSWSTTIPTQTNADDYTVYYKVVGDATHADYTPSPNTVAVTINKADAVITDVPAAVEGLVYTGAAQTLISAGSATGGELQYSLDNSNWSTNLPTGTDASDYTVYYKVVGDANHTDIDAASLNVTIAAPQAVIGDPNNADQITAFLNYYDGQNVATLTIERPVLNNMFNTLCLPFDMDEDQIAASSLNGIEIYELEDVSVVNDELYLYTGAQKNAIVAGRPYLVKFSDALQLDQLTFANVVVNNANLTEEAVTIKGVTFTGTFQPVVLGAQTELDFNGGHLFLMANNTLMWPNTNNPLKPFRAYFTVNVDAGQAAGMPMRRGMPAHIGQPAQMPTGVDNVQGDKVQSTKVMIDGVLYIIRGEHMYDAQGQVVK